MSKPLVALERAVILVLASFGRDAPTLAEIVERNGAAARICASGREICAAYSDDTAAILVTEEALAEAAVELRECLHKQPPWSDVPVVVLSGSRGRAGSSARWHFFRQLGNVMLLDRPLSGEALAIALEAAFRARAWQYVVRDQMHKLEAQNVDLERKVRERTLALQAESEERRRIERALNEARRLEAIGRLAGGVAHDFNNLLQVISSACELLPFARDDAARSASLTDTIMRATERGSRLTQQMLALGRRQALSTEEVDLARHIMEMKELLQQALREKTTLELRLQADLWHAHADSTQLEVALLNLVVNARDVLPVGGTVTLTGRNVRLPAADIAEAADLHGDFVCLSVTDSGPGMPVEVAARAFEPFFTTKRLGEGSGLGLSQVYGFARQSGGAAWIRTGARGTTVAIALPRGGDASSATEVRKVHVDEDRHRLQGLRVLCVEDDATVAELAVSLLKSFGCVAAAVHSTDEALRTGLHDSDLVFTDVQMPGAMDGISLAKEIARRHPGMPVLLASGYVVAPERLHTLDAHVIAKPYTAETLRSALLRCLDDQRGDRAATGQAGAPVPT